MPGPIEGGGGILGFIGGSMSGPIEGGGGILGFIGGSMPGPIEGGGDILGGSAPEGRRILGGMGQGNPGGPQLGCCIGGSGMGIEGALGGMQGEPGAPGNPQSGCGSRITSSGIGLATGLPQNGQLPPFRRVYLGMGRINLTKGGRQVPDSSHGCEVAPDTMTSGSFTTVTVDSTSSCCGNACISETAGRWSSLVNTTFGGGYNASSEVTDKLHAG
jgi:hypothetical protein